MANWSKHLDAARRFIEAAKVSLNIAPEAVPILAHRSIEHMIMALAYKFSPREASTLATHGRRRAWLAQSINKGLVQYRLLVILDELDRIYKRGTYLLENGELARKALELAREALSIVEDVLGARR